MITEYEFRYRHLGFLVISLAIAGLFALNYHTLETERLDFPANASVEKMNTSSVGLVTGSNLNFGKVPEGSEVRKNLEVNSDSLVMIKIKSTGNISKMLEFQDSILLKNQTQIEIKFKATDSGYYSGRLKAKILKPTGEMGERWLKFRSMADI